MYTLDLKGDVVDDELAQMYDEFDMNCINPKMVSDFLKSADNEPITINLNSYGGDVFAADDIYSQLQAYNGEVTVIVGGIAASSGSIIAMGSDKLLMTTPSILMIHRCDGEVSGNVNDLKKAEQVQQTIDTSIATTYSAKTGKTVDECLALMNDETWLTADMAVDMKLADGIAEPAKKNIAITNSLVSLPSHQKVEKFVNMLNKKHKTTNKRNKNIVNAKLAILKE